MTDTDDDRSDSERTQTTDSASIVNRRDVLAASAGLSTVALAGCVGGGPSSGGNSSNSGGGDGGNTSSTGGSPDYSNETLTVAVWAGIYAKAFDKTVAKTFEEKTGATVEVVPAGGSILSEIKAAPKDDPPYDVVAAEGFNYWQGVNEGYYLKIREKNIPNLDKVYPYLKNIRGTKYGVPTDGALNGIIYRTDIGWTPTTWADLLPKNNQTERIGFEGSWYIYPFEVAANSLDKANDINELYKKKYHSAIYDRMREYAKDVKVWTGSFAKIKSSLLKRIISMSMWYSGMGNAAAVNQDALEFSTPDNTAGYLDLYCPVRGTNNRRMAEDFLNHMLNAKVQEKWANKGYVYVSRPEVKYPKQVREQYPHTNEDWKKISFADFSKLGQYSSTFAKKFQSIQS